VFVNLTLLLEVMTYAQPRAWTERYAVF